MKQPFGLLPRQRLGRSPSRSGYRQCCRMGGSMAERAVVW